MPCFSPKLLYCTTGRFASATKHHFPAVHARPSFDRVRAKSSAHHPCLADGDVSKLGPALANAAQGTWQWPQTFLAQHK